MGKNVFISYKYKDTCVTDLKKMELFFDGTIFGSRPRKTRVRDFVDILQDIIGKDHVNLGEKDGESLKDFSEGKIESHLKKKIYRSSITIVMISKGMKELHIDEKDQWIPWEISYSLRVVNRADSSSQMNAVLGVVLPDENNSYNWYYEENSECKCLTHKRNQLFDILKSNMFNLKKPELTNCGGLEIFPENGCFIETVKWDLMINNHNYYIDKAIAIRDDQQKNDSYKVKIEMD
jgi:hypothetical protein